MRRVLLIASALIVAALGAGSLYVRLAPSDPAFWHADPLTRPTTGRPNEARAMPDAPADFTTTAWPMAPEALAALFDQVALAQPRTARLAGDPTQAFATYVQRSLLVSYPDYISVRAIPVEGGAALAIWSRSRFGHSDMGVNRARLEGWLAALDRKRGQ